MRSERRVATAGSMEGLMATISFMLFLLVIRLGLGSACSFNMVNNCGFTVWPAILPSAGHPMLANGGFTLYSGQSRAVVATPGWSGRFWPRTGCSFDSSGQGSCATGDCGRKLECNGIGGQPPASLLEITLNGAGGQDFYDVSLVDGFNIPVSLCPRGGSGQCKAAGCASDLNSHCPGELQMKSNGQVVACKSACLAFNTPQYCCTQGFVDACSPSFYSQLFKAVCPAAYSYAKDDPSSLYTCHGAGDYTLTFCPAQLGC